MLSLTQLSGQRDDFCLPAVQMYTSVAHQRTSRADRSRATVQALCPRPLLSLTSALQIHGWNVPLIASAGRGG